MHVSSLDITYHNRTPKEHWAYAYKHLLKHDAIYTIQKKFISEHLLVWLKLTFTFHCLQNWSNQRTWPSQRSGPGASELHGTSTLPTLSPFWFSSSRPMTLTDIMCPCPCLGIPSLLYFLTSPHSPSMKSAFMLSMRKGKACLWKAMRPHQKVFMLSHVQTFSFIL